MRTLFLVHGEHMSQNAYLQSPSINGEQIVFVTDDDIWQCSMLGGEARRLTTKRGVTRFPKFSPDGKKIAYTSNESGQSDVYILNSNGSMSERASYFGVNKVVRWVDNTNLLVLSAHDDFARGALHLYNLNIKNGEYKKLPWGPCHDYISSTHGNLIGRNLGDPSRWKRYQGGTAGHFWIDQSKKGQFKRIFQKIGHGLSNPEIIDGNLYFISDFEGVANIYKSDLQGKNVKRLTHQKKYYIRNFSHSEGNIVYQCAGNIYQYNFKSKGESQIQIETSGTFIQASERFEEPIKYLQSFSLASRAKELTLTSRGQLYIMPPWNGAPLRLGDRKLFYKSAVITPEQKFSEVACIEIDNKGEENVVLFQIKANGQTTQTKLMSHFGKAFFMTPSPDNKKIALVSNRNEVWLFDRATKKKVKIATNECHFINGLSWSPDGRYVCWNDNPTHFLMGIKIYDTKTKTSRFVIPPVGSDFSPSFCPSGKYLFFIGAREFHPTYGEISFEMSFSSITRPYVVLLDPKAPLPWKQFDRWDFPPGEEQDGKKTKKPAKIVVNIDWKDIEQRVHPLPLPMGGYSQLEAVNDKLFFIRNEVKGADPNGDWRDEGGPSTLSSFCYKENRCDDFLRQIHSLAFSPDKRFLIADASGDLRLVSVEMKPNEGEENIKRDGWIDPERMLLKINPKLEWLHMYQEAWVLQREHFWSPDMSNIDWVEIYNKYLPLLDKVNTRVEFSDLVWEMQGELGTSHCYESGGDYHRRPHHHPVGQLGAELKFNSKGKSFEIVSINRGDSWIKGHTSPLLGPGAGLTEGDSIHEIDGVKPQNLKELQQLLEGKVNRRVTLRVKRKKSTQTEQVSVKLIGQKTNILYREWVDQNREYVHKKSKGKFGYLHIPDMSVKGFSEFWKGYLQEVHREGLIVDVRYNGGGNVSQLILKTLAQKLQGFDVTRYMGIEKYPRDVLHGPIVCLTNELAGSDGDIFSHNFKLMEIGPLIGKRTWGGVIGIWPRQELNDGSWTSQPEFSFWFRDVGYQVENYGTDPDIDIEITPQDWKNGIDAQLERGLSEMEKLAKKFKYLKPELKKLPNLKAPVLK